MASFFSNLKSALLPPALVVIGGVMIYGGVNEKQTAAALADHGKNAKADVVEVEWKEKGVTKREKNFHAKVHFLTEDKQDINATISISKELGQQLRDGQAQPALDIRYLPEDPTHARLASETDGSGFLFGLGGVLAAAGVGIFFWRRRKAAQPEAQAEQA